MILVVDDHNDTRRALTLLLQRDGYEVGAAASAAEAWACLEARAPHCVILDYHMPGTDGLTFLRRMRADARFDATNVIVFSAQDGEVADLSLAAGAQAFVRKGSLDWGAMQRMLARYCTPTRWPAGAPVGPRRARDAG